VKITKRWINKWEPCREAVAWFYGQKLRDSVEIIEYFIRHRKESCDYLDWALWAIPRFLGRKGQLRFAIYSAESCIKQFEKEYPDDDRPRKAIKAAKAVLKNDTKDTRSAAWYAASAAEYAASAARSAEYAARSAGYAARSAGYAESAARSAESVARSVGYAAMFAAELKISRYGLRLMRGEEVK